MEEELSPADGREALVSLVAESLARRYCPEEIASAALAVYAARVRGFGIARNPGIDLLLYLAGQRNIADVLHSYKPRPGGRVLIVAVYPANRLPQSLIPGVLEPPSSCTAGSCDRTRETRLAVFPLRERVYRMQGE
ncbi:hypothetical protein CF15_00415 [Pyrodictium occultum]|uniref:Uncharacterized protein n=1 Tax=Pyrodictium occultum TaxID=2309 RepID=A0A0V8RTI2_PYROC|nr:hypothetical protein [Pyrodictium occultum]KSW11367.1 hypothetical protein CF15_00415 [Pyrodictium occultum]